MASGFDRPVVPTRFLSLHKRRRIAGALAELCTEQGYRTVTVAQVCSRAHVARATYYELFRNMDEVFLATVEAGMGETGQLVEDACLASSGGFQERLRAGLAALLDSVSRRPEMAWVCLVEAPAVVPLGFERHDAAIRHYAGLIQKAAPPAARPPRAAAESVVGGLAAVIRMRVQQGEAAELPALLPELSHFVLVSLHDRFSRTRTPRKTGRAG